MLNFWLCDIVLYEVGYGILGYWIYIVVSENF